GTGTLLSSASSLNATTAGVIRLLGGPLGGVLFALVGIRWLIMADVISYLVAAGLVLMTTPVVVRRTRAVTGMLADLSAGMRALRSSLAARGLLAVQVAFLTANAALSAVLIPFGMQRLGGSTQTGLLMAALGVGFLLGSSLLRIVLDRVQPRRVLAVSLAVTAVGYPAMFTTTNLNVVLPAAIILGLAGVITLSVPTTTVQRVTDNAVLGRINAVFLSAAAAATLIGAITGPFLAQLLDLGGAAAVVGAGTMATAGMAWIIIPTIEVPTTAPADFR
ncbi:MAG: MFS transporter, partial [Microlunatus sp.]|nr:MFS transporter [Microlunatus sp.]